MKNVKAKAGAASLIIQHPDLIFLCLQTTTVPYPIEMAVIISLQHEQGDDPSEDCRLGILGRSRPHRQQFGDAVGKLG